MTTDKACRIRRKNLKIGNNKERTPLILFLSTHFPFAQKCSNFFIPSDNVYEFYSTCSKWFMFEGWMIWVWWSCYECLGGKYHDMHSFIRTHFYINYNDNIPQYKYYYLQSEKYIREWDFASCLININKGFWQKQFRQ